MASDGTDAPEELTSPSETTPEPPEPKLSTSRSMAPVSSSTSRQRR